MIKTFTAATLGECIEKMRRAGLGVFNIRRAYRMPGSSTWNLEVVG